MPRIARSVLVLALTLLLPTLATRVWAEEGLDLDAPLPTDPAIVRVATLENGLTYWIRPHDMPEGKVTLLMHVGSGSVQESEEQRGLAHFLEHLAFNGSEHFPPGEVIEYFESMGMVFGRHQNAMTSYDQTTYILSLPDTETTTIERGLLFLTDVAHRLSLLPEEVEKERAVILEEQRARQGVGLRVMEQMLSLLLPGSRLAERIPIGLTEVIENAPPERLRSYYETWYRPERTTLLVVGDVDPAAVEPLLTKAFSDWKATTPEPTDVDMGAAGSTRLDAAVLTDPEQTDAFVTLSTVQPEPPLDTVGDHRRRLVERLGRSVLNRRLGTLVQENQARFQSADVNRQGLAGFLLGGLSLQAPAADWADALEQVVLEIRRLRQHGVDPAELERVKGGILAGFEQMAEGAGNRPAMRVAMGLNRSITRGRTPPSAAQRRDLARALLPGVTAEEVIASFRETVDPAEGLLVLVLPEREGVAVPTKDEVLAVLREALSAEVTKQATREALGSILDAEPAPGDVSFYESDAELGVTTLTLANGIRVNVKPLEHVDTVNVKINLFGGVVEENGGNRGITEAAALAFEAGRAATKSLSPADVTQYLEPLQVSVGGSADEISIALNLGGSLEDLPAGLRLAHLLLKEPRVDEGVLAAWKRTLPPLLEQLKVNVPMQGNLALKRIASGDDDRFVVPTLEQYEAITVVEAQAWLDRLVQTAPIEVAIAGGIEVAEAERLVRLYLGSLPPRPDRWQAIRSLRKVRQNPGPIVENVTVASVNPMAMVMLAWRGVPRSDTPGQIALFHASSILTPRLLKEVREERGLTYSIGSGYQFTDFEGLDGLLVQFAAAPDQAKAAADVAKGIVEVLAQEGPTDEEVAAVERQMANVFEAQMQASGFWIQALSKLAANGRSLAEIRERLAALQKVDGAAVTETLAEVVVESRYVEIVVAP